jgi:hypothetical protein
MKREIVLYRDTTTGRITDNWGYEYGIPQREVAAQHNPPFRMESGDLIGDMTITGNLTVQQSQWVYLRGPITGSGALINGAITASNLWVRSTTGEAGHPMEGMGLLRIDEDILLGGESLKEKLGEFERVGVLETEFQRLENKLMRVESEVGELRGKGDDRGLMEVKTRLEAFGKRIEFLEKSIGEVNRNWREIEELEGLRTEFHSLQKEVSRRMSELEDIKEVGGSSDIEKVVHQLRDDVNIIMSILHK